MIKKITYESKNALQNDEDVPDNEKVTDTDMNEIKDVVNTNADELNRTKEKLDLTINAPLIYKGSVETKEELELIENPKSGYIYTVNSEQKNYIYSDTEWIEYNATIDISSISSTLEEQNNKIEENTTNILENSNAIKQNSTDISNIEKSVSQNTSNISENTQNISDLNSKVTQLEGKSAISVWNNATQGFTTNKEATIKLNQTSCIKGSDLQLSNNTIICKKNGFVGISYKIYLNSEFGDQNNIIAKLLKNNNEIARYQYRTSGAGAQAMTSETMIFKVKANDNFKINFINYASNTTTGNTAVNNANSLNVFYI